MVIKMKSITKYLILIIASIVLCAGIVITNYVEYTQGKQFVTEDIYSASSQTYFVQKERDISETDLPNTININTATAQELSDFLPGIGKAKAENIVAYRKAIGGFKSVDELIEVSGIGESTLESIRSYCRISDD